jgi:hypothetical protein
MYSGNCIVVHFSFSSLHEIHNIAGFSIYDPIPALLLCHDIVAMAPTKYEPVHWLHNNVTYYHIAHKKQDDAKDVLLSPPVMETSEDFAQIFAGCGFGKEIKSSDVVFIAERHEKGRYLTQAVIHPADNTKEDPKHTLPAIANFLGHDEDVPEWIKGTYTTLAISPTWIMKYHSDMNSSTHESRNAIAEVVMKRASLQGPNTCVATMEVFQYAVENTRGVLIDATWTPTPSAPSSDTVKEVPAPSVVDAPKRNNFEISHLMLCVYVLYALIDTLVHAHIFPAFIAFLVAIFMVFHMICVAIEYCMVLCGDTAASNTAE